MSKFYYKNSNERNPSNEDEFIPIYHLKDKVSDDRLFSIKNIFLFSALGVSLYYFYPFLEVQRALWTSKMSEKVTTKVSPSIVRVWTAKVINGFDAVNNAITIINHRTEGFGMIGSFIIKAINRDTRGRY